MKKNFPVWSEKTINQAAQGQSDDPRQAMESGEPGLVGHIQGHIECDRPDDLEERSTARGRADDSPEWESGRHQAL